MPSRCQIQETFRDAGRLASDLPVHAAHLRAELGLPLPDHLLRVLLLEQVHETHGERAAGARDCVDVPPKNDVSAEGKETLTGASWIDPRFCSQFLRLAQKGPRAAACFESLNRYSMPAHIRAAQQVSLPSPTRRDARPSRPTRRARLHSAAVPREP